MIQLHNISLSYQNRVLFDNLNYSIPRYARVVITGPSGCGKSSLLASIIGFVTPVVGKIVVDGQQVNSDNIEHIRRKIAWLSQDTSMPYTTVQECVDTPFLLKCNEAKRPSRVQVEAQFAQVGLSADFFEKRWEELSGGERQRIMLVVAVLLDKPILLLDEPTSALDAASVDLVISYLHHLTDTTLVVVSHDPRFIASFDTVITL